MSEAYERIDSSKRFDGFSRDSHEIRYRIARQFVGENDTVIDAGCGVGYGRDILEDSRFGVKWCGIDKNPPHDGVMQADFEKPGDTRVWPLKFDTFVGLEIIEHLDDNGVDWFVNYAKLAKKYIVISTPIVRNANPFHKQQFYTVDIVKMFDDGHTWKLYQSLVQDEKYGIFIFKR